MDEMLARVASFALLPLSVAIAVSAMRLSRLGFYYSSSSHTLVCCRCRQTFSVDDELARLESHEQQCSSPRFTASASQQLQQGCRDYHQNQNSCFPGTSSNVTNLSSRPPTYLDTTPLSADNSALLRPGQTELMCESARPKSFERCQLRKGQRAQMLSRTNFLPRDAMQARPIPSCSVSPFVSQSVRLSRS